MVSAVNARNFVIDPQRVKCREKICPACRPPFLIPPGCTAYEYGTSYLSRKSIRHASLWKHMCYLHSYVHL